MASEPKAKFKNMKVLSVDKAGSYEKGGKTIQLHRVVLQGVDDTSKIVTGDAKDPLPETVVKDGIVPDVWVYENEYQGNVNIGLFFPTQKGEGGKSGGGQKVSPEEIKIKKFEAMGKVVGVGYSYAVELLRDKPDVKVDDLCNMGDDIAERMKKKTIEFLGG